jgi:guanylate kinase
MRSILLLLAGPSAAGKSTVIRALQSLDGRFRYVRPFVTRELRVGESDKIAVSENELSRLWQNGELVVINDLYGVKYGTPRAPIQQPEPGTYPIVDWPISQVEVMRGMFRGSIFTAYLCPPDDATLQQRIAGRNNSADRLAQARLELERVRAHEFDKMIDVMVVTHSGMTHQCAREVYLSFLARFGGGYD